MSDKELIEFFLLHIEKSMTGENTVVFVVGIEIGIPALIKNTFWFINRRQKIT